MEKSGKKAYWALSSDPQSRNFPQIFTVFTFYSGNYKRQELVMRQELVIKG